MRLRCIGCGYAGHDDDAPHCVYERWSGSAANFFGAADDESAIVADGYEPERTSAAWFQCGKCGKRQSFYFWRQETPDNLEGATVEDDGITPCDPISPDPWSWSV